MKPSIDSPPGELTNERPLSPAEELLEQTLTPLYRKATPDFWDGKSVDRRVRYLPEDLKKIQEAESKHRDHTERSILFNKVMFSHSEFWGSADMYVSTKFDDYFNATDLICEFIDEEGGRAGLLSIDTTVSNESNFFTKINTLLNRIDEGKLVDLNYGPDEDGLIEKENFAMYVDIPHITLALSEIDLERFAQGLLSVEELKHVILKEVLNQLTDYRLYIERSKVKAITLDVRKHLMRKIENVIEIITSLFMKTPPMDLGVLNGVTEFAYDSDKLHKAYPRINASAQGE